MKKIIQFRIFKGEQYYVAEGVDLPIVTQAATLDELARNIHEATALHLEGEDLRDFEIAADPALLANIELEPIQHA